jgi:hypothetical protein
MRTIIGYFERTLCAAGVGSSKQPMGLEVNIACSECDNEGHERGDDDYGENGPRRCLSFGHNLRRLR